VAHNVNSVYSYLKWDELHFKPFRPIITCSAVYQTIVMGYCLYSIKKGSISVNPAVASKDQFSRLCQILIGINVVGLVLCLQKMPMLIYPETGWIYATCVVFCKFLPRLMRVFVCTTCTSNVININSKY
jgi:hypothetical protein